MGEWRKLNTELGRSPEKRGGGAAVEGMAVGDGGGTAREKSGSWASLSEYRPV